MFVSLHIPVKTKCKIVEALVHNYSSEFTIKLLQLKIDQHDLKNFQLHYLAKNI